MSFSQEQEIKCFYPLSAFRLPVFAASPCEVLALNQICNFSHAIYQKNTCKPDRLSLSVDCKAFLICWCFALFPLKPTAE